jgi:hypothetical protein
MRRPFATAFLYPKARARSSTIGARAAAPRNLPAGIGFVNKNRAML